MVNYDYPNEEELQPYVVHDYDLVANDYPMEDNNAHSTYDQFIQLRDTLIYSGKKYNGKAGYKLCVGEKEETVEVLEPQTFKLAFEPDTVGVASATLQSRGTYATRESGSQYGLLTVKINKSGWYRIEHKEEILLRAGTDKKIFCFVEYYPIQSGGTYPTTPQQIAVFDMAGEFSKTFHGTFSGHTSGTDPNGSCSGTCSVPISFVLGDIIQKMTAYGVIEKNLYKGDILTLRCYNSDTQPDWLVFQPASNWLQVQYIDLPIK